MSCPIRLIALVLIAASCAAVRAAAFAEATGLQEEKIRVLLVTGGHGFEQEAFFALFDSIPEITVTKATYPDAAELLAPKLAESCDVIVFYDMWARGISPPQQQALLELLESGIGVVALHHSLGGHQDWPEYAQVIGGKFHLREREVDGRKLGKSGFAHDQDLQVSVVDQEHPITRGLEDFEIHDETYSDYDTDPNVRVLLTTEHPKSDRELAWVKTYGNSRVFFLILGNDHVAYENAQYRLLVRRGIRWAAGRPADDDAPWTSLFNGQDLAGWNRNGNADWQVQDGLLIGQQGKGNAPGDLLSEAEFDDFELRVTYQVVWPANTGVWYRYQSARQAYQADILEYKNPFALSGSLYCTGKMFLKINEDASLIDREGWNTVVIRAAGNRHVIFLNGKKTADVRDDTSGRGRVGFQVHAGDQFASMKVLIREVMIREL